MERRITMRALKADIGFKWPIESSLRDLAGLSPLLDAFLALDEAIAETAEILACARPRFYRKHRADQLRYVTAVEQGIFWFLCGGTRREGDGADAYVVCCAVHDAVGLGPAEVDIERLATESRFRAALRFRESLLEIIASCLAQARETPRSTIRGTISDGDRAFEIEILCERVEEAEELLLIVDRRATSRKAWITDDEFDAIAAAFLEGRSATELEYPAAVVGLQASQRAVRRMSWAAPRPK